MMLWKNEPLLLISVICNAKKSKKFWWFCTRRLGFNQTLQWLQRGALLRFVSHRKHSSLLCVLNLFPLMLEVRNVRASTAPFFGI